MKKLISMLLSILLVVSLLPSAVFATEATNAQFAFSVDPAETTQFKVGDTFKVNLALANNPGFGAMTLKLTWNAEAVAFEGFETELDEDTEEYFLQSDVLRPIYAPTVNHEKGTIVCTRTSNITKTGNVFTANFKVVGEGSFNIGLKDGNDFEYIDQSRVAISHSIDQSALENLSCAAPNPEPEGNPIASVTVSHPNIETTTDPVTGATSMVMNIVAGVSEKLKLDITAVNSEADATQVINWTSTNSNVAEVIDGVLKAYKAGTVTLKAFAVDASAAAVMAAEEPVPLATLTVNVTDVAEDKFTVSLGNDLNVTPADAISVPVTVSHATEGSTYNAYELEFEYDSDYLTLTTASDTTDGKEFTVEDNDGTVTIRRYGDALTAGSKAFDLAFTAKKVGQSNVKLLSAKVGTYVDAQDKNVPEAQIVDDLTVVNVTGYNVSLPDGFTGANVADSTADYTFEATNKYYDYTFTVTVGGEPVENAVTDNGNGTYTIAKDKITGNIAIQKATEVGKKFDVTVDGNGKDQLKPEGDLTIGEDAAQYATAYQFKVASKGEGYSYEVSVKIGENEAKVYAPDEDGVYTVAGTDITGNITITVTETEPTVEPHSVTITGNGAEDVVDGTAAKTVEHGENYTFNLKLEDGYDYTITAIMNEKVVDAKKAEQANDDGFYTYTIESITADLAITIEKSNLKVEVDEYVTLKDNSSLFLVTATMDLEDGQALAYNSNLMYLKEFKTRGENDELTDTMEQKYSYLVVVEAGQTLSEKDALERITVQDVTNDTKAEQTLAVDYDVNGSRKLDINDAQLVYDMYKAVYGSSDVATVTVKKFLKGDLNGDRTINVSDAAAVVNEILNPTTGE